MINKGDTIGIISLAGVCEKEKIKLAVQNIQNLGFKVRLSKNIDDQNMYLAGNDEDKLEELYSFFKDSEVKLILNARGGYGSIRLINKIDYDIIKSNPKLFCGFSDITALLLMFYKKCGLVTYHGPMACSDFGDKECTSYKLLETETIKMFFKAMSNDSLEFTGTKIYKYGLADGILWGGNLSTVVSLCGQDFIPEEDFLFFTEDLNEPVYKIDKMFTQLFNIDKFKQNCKGIILGDFLNVDNEEWLECLFKSFQLPTVGGFKITHKLDKITLPIGVQALLKGSTLYVG